MTDIFTQTIHAIRDGWIDLATARFISRGNMDDLQAKIAATELWKTANLDIEPEDAVDLELANRG